MTKNSKSFKYIAISIVIAVFISYWRRTCGHGNFEASLIRLSDLIGSRKLATYVRYILFIALG